MSNTTFMVTSDNNSDEWTMELTEDPDRNNNWCIWRDDEQLEGFLRSWHWSGLIGEECTLDEYEFEDPRMWYKSQLKRSAKPGIQIEKREPKKSPIPPPLPQPKKVQDAPVRKTSPKRKGTSNTKRGRSNTNREAPRWQTGVSPIHELFTSVDSPRKKSSFRSGSSESPRRKTSPTPTKHLRESHLLLLSPESPRGRKIAPPPAFGLNKNLPSPESPRRKFSLASRSRSPSPDDTSIRKYSPPRYGSVVSLNLSKIAEQGRRSVPQVIRSRSISPEATPGRTSSPARLSTSESPRTKISVGLARVLRASNISTVSPESPRRRLSSPSRTPSPESPRGRFSATPAQILRTAHDVTRVSSLGRPAFR